MSTDVSVEDRFCETVGSLPNGYRFLGFLPVKLCSELNADDGLKKRGLPECAIVSEAGIYRLIAQW